MHVAGVDFGTYSVDVVVINDEPLKIVHEESIPREEILRNPQTIPQLLSRLNREYSLKAITVSSGYGIPLKPARKATIDEIKLATFIHEHDETRRLRILGLRKTMEILNRMNLPIWFTPGVIHLPTVPYWKKIGRIDIGTSDKVFVAAAVLREEVEERKVPISQVDVIVVEVGYAYTAALRLKNGKIIDSVGGTTGYQGYMGIGFWDAEVAYLLCYKYPAFSKELLFRGGISTILNKDYPPPAPQEVEDDALRGDKNANNAIKALAESALKDALSLFTNGIPRRIYLSGRWSRSNLFTSCFEEYAKPILRRLNVELTKLSKIGSTKEAALGAAIIASGLAGGKYKWVVDSLELDRSSGSILDYLESLAPIKRDK